jgi:Domain of unknown function (DUF5615)
MLRLASDGAIVRGLRRRVPTIDLIRVQDFLDEGASDSEVLAWAAGENRVLITNDRNTLIQFASRRVTSGENMPGVIVTSNEQSIGAAIDDILLIAECISETELRDRVVVFLPFAG